MYNGIGLTTARGSGTNGYVIRNLSHVRPPPVNKQNKSQDDFRKAPPTERKPNKELVQHDLKRKVEVQCMELRLSLEDDGLDEADIDDKVDDLRKTLMSRLDEVKPRDAKSLQNHETHLLQAAKNEENIKFARAFGIREQDHVEGQAFDRELQEQKKQERMERRQREMEQQLERQERREKEAYRAERKRRYDDDDKDRRTSRGRTSSQRHRRRRSPSPSSESSSSGSESDSGSDRERYSKKRRHRSDRRSRTRSVSTASASSSSHSESDDDDDLRRRHSNNKSSHRQRSSSPSASSGSYSDDSKGRTRKQQRRSS